MAKANNTDEAKRIQAEQEAKKIQEEQEAERIRAEQEAQRNRELQQARNEKAGYESTRSQKQRQVNANQGKIDRLKIVKSNLETQKDNAINYYKSLKSYSENADNMGDWYGTMYAKAKKVFGEEIVPQYDGYVKRIDEILDCVCDEITKLENDNMRLNGDILHIGRLINSLINKIRTLCN